MLALRLDSGILLEKSPFLLPAGFIILFNLIDNYFLKN